MLKAANEAIDELLEIDDQATLDLITVQVWGVKGVDALAESDEECGDLTEEVIDARCSEQCLEDIFQLCKKALARA